MTFLFDTEIFSPVVTICYVLSMKSDVIETKVL